MYTCILVRYLDNHWVAVADDGGRSKTQPLSWNGADGRIVSLITLSLRQDHVGYRLHPAKISVAGRYQQPV